MHVLAPFLGRNLMNEGMNIFNVDNLIGFRIKRMPLNTLNFKIPYYASFILPH